MASKLTQATRMLGAAAALGLALYAGGMLLSDDPSALTASLFGEGVEPVDPQREHETRQAKDRADARGIAMLGRRSVFDEVESEVEPPPADGTLRVTEADARAGFDYVVGKVDKLGKGRRRLEVEEWEEVWRTSNDAFTALSMHLDASDPAEAAELEDAHRRLKEALRRVRVRGGKKTKLR